MTKITSKQFKVINNVNFNGNGIENALINAQSNTITGLQITDIQNLDNALENINSGIDGITNIIDDITDELENKQNNLIAGAGITIINDIISANGTSIINLQATGTGMEISLTPNSVYTLDCGLTVTTLDITLNLPSDTTITNSILLHTYIGITNIIINYGTNLFFGNETPEITSSGYYDIIYVYNNLIDFYVGKLVFVR